MQEVTGRPQTAGAIQEIVPHPLGCALLFAASFDVGVKIKL